jgi:hypothetical protein
MSRFGVAAAVAFTATVALVSSANAVPSFTRQTGLTCAQCHITFANVPDFTFTGKKFRLNGYRAPYVAEKIESGEEGALNGKRLMLGIQNIFSFRLRNNLLSQSKPSSLVGTTSNPSAVTSQPGTSISWFYVGGVGDHIGLWNEFYLDAAGGGTGSSIFRVESFDELDVKFVVNPGYDNILGLSVSTQSFKSIGGFDPFNSGSPSSLQRGGIGNAHTPYVNLAAYAFLKDRFLIVGGVQPGEDNYSFAGMNYLANLGIAINNSDYNQLWYAFFMKAGNDGVPIVTTTGLDADRNILYNDAFTGIRATRGTTSAQQVSYRAGDLGDFIRTVQEIHYGFVDRGPHSLSAVAGFTYNNETYADGANIKQTGWGLTARYYYNRTYGIQYGKNSYIKNDFTDKNGVVHPISKAPLNLLSGWTFFYRPAMNFSVSLGLGAGVKGGGNTLDDTRNFQSNGWNWSLGFDWMF